MKQNNYLVDGERAIISFGGRYDYGYRYCYTYEPGFEGFEKKTASEIIPSLQELPSAVKLVQCGYDNEFFKDEAEAVKLIRAISQSGRNVTFTTKKDLSLEAIADLQFIYRQMQSSQYMVGCVSLLGTNTARILEPNAPDQRIATIRELYTASIPTLVYIRPLFPTILDEEIETIFAKTKDSCNGYVIGKMIFDEKNAGRFNLPRTDKKLIASSKDLRKWYDFCDSRAEKLARRPDVFLHRSDALSTIINKGGKL